MENTNLPETLAGAILTEPMWLQLWLLLLIGTHLTAIVFVAGRGEDGWRVRKESIAILISFFVAAMIMEWMYGNYGYVRLLGLAHIVAWTPVYVLVLIKRKDIGFSSAFGKYIHLYLLIAGLSLCVDVIDVVRFMLGDGELYLRWS